MKVDAAVGETDWHHVPLDMIAKKDTAHVSEVLLQSTQPVVKTSYKTNLKFTMISHLKKTLMMKKIYWWGN